MTNEGDSNAPSTNPQTQPPGQPPVVPPAPSEGEVRANPDQITKSDQSTAKELAREFRWVEIGQFAVNSALAVIGIIALSIYHGQLKEMRKATRATQVAAQAAKKSADTAASQLELTERPWMDASLIITGPLTIDQDGAHLSAQITLENVGHSPAVKGDVQVKMFANFLEHPDSRKVREELCKEVEGASAQPLNDKRQFLQTWFLGKQLPPTNYRLSINKADLNKAAIDIPRSMFPDAPPKDQVFNANIVFCVAYFSSFGETQYHTGYIWQVVPMAGPPFFGLGHGEIPVMYLKPPFIANPESN